MGNFGKCGWCGKNDATHFCKGCGKWICDSALCVARGAASAGVQYARNLLAYPNTTSKK